MQLAVDCKSLLNRRDVDVKTLRAVNVSPEAVRQSFEGMLKRHEQERSFFLDHFGECLREPEVQFAGADDDSAPPDYRRA